jgi:hypothetical protein
VPIHLALLVFVLAMGVTVVAAARMGRLRGDVRRARFWLLLSTLAATISAASALVSSTRHAGTGFTTSYGWPKPYYFRYLSETGDQSSGFVLLYFAGNTLAVAGALLILWILCRAAQR